MNATQTYIDFQQATVPGIRYNSHADLKNWLHCFSKHINCELLENGFLYPEKFAKGYAKVHVIEPGLSYRMVNYKLNTDVEYNCEPATDFNLLIYFYQITSPDKIIFQVGENIIENEGKNYRAIVMTNSRVLK
jgi:hypothetical protein